MLGRFLTLFLTLIKQRVATLRGTVGRSNTRERVEMGILTQGDWHYVIKISPSKAGMFSWVVIRFHVGETAAAGQQIIAGAASLKEAAEREAEDARRRIMAADAEHGIRDNT